MEQGEKDVLGKWLPGAKDQFRSSPGALFQLFPVT